jgi:pimeloyl-ACP methyl ester carboxylesterase
VSSQTVGLTLAGAPIAIEFEWVGQVRPHSPLLVFLHEGLGSVAMWKDFPRALCEAAGCRGLVYSRPGYGRSTPRSAGEKLPVDFMHVQAREVLPALLATLGAADDGAPLWLFGHSDGASIALIHAAAFPQSVAGIIALAPHIMVEDVSVASIAQARQAYLKTDLKARLARYHDDADSAFWGWNDIWLDPRFRGWSIEELLPGVRCPVLAVQGEDDEYGTMEQIDGLARRAPRVELLKLARCGHSPQRDRPEDVTGAAIEFIARHSR